MHYHAERADQGLGNERIERIESTARAMSNVTSALAASSNTADALPDDLRAA